MREIDEKRLRVTSLLDRLDLDALVLRRPGNVAWFSCGGRTHILMTPEYGVAALVLTRDGCEVVTAVNEAPRLRDEELGALSGAKWRVLPWDTDLAGALPGGPRVGSDGPLRDAVDVSADVEAMRRSLVPAEVERYRRVGHAAACALTDAALAMVPGQPEWSAAGLVAGALSNRGLDPMVLLVAGESRVRTHRHPLPTNAEVGRICMLVACARGQGLVANLTRFVSFTKPPHEEYDRLLDVEGAFLATTRAGTRVGEVFAAGAAAYGPAGFAPDEAAKHHQGGPTGYETRDYLATAASEAKVESWQAFAWNPSVPGLKVEDTFVATPEGPEVLTVDDHWPLRRERPDILER